MSVVCPTPLAIVEPSQEVGPSTIQSVDRVDEVLVVYPNVIVASLFMYFTAYFPVEGSIFGVSPLIVNSKPLPSVPNPSGYGLTWYDSMLPKSGNVILSARSETVATSIVVTIRPPS